MHDQNLNIFGTSGDTCMNFSGSLFHTGANDFESFSCQFLEKDHGHCTLFVISKFKPSPHETSWSGSFLFWGGFLILWNNRKLFFFRFALSVTRTSTPRLSGDHGLQDDGILEPGVLRSTVAAYFSFHGDTDLNLREHCRMSFTAGVCLRSHHKRAMSKWCGVYTRVTHLCNRFQTACAISLRWRHNGCDGVSNHQPFDYLLNRLFRHRSKKTSKLRVTGLCVGNSPGPVNSPHKWPVTRKMSPFYDVIMSWSIPSLCVFSANAGPTICRDHIIWPCRPCVQAYTPCCRRITIEHR